MTPEEAAQRVEIGHFARKGFKPTGVIHVGANNGYEIDFYLAMGCKPILAFEPLRSAFAILIDKFHLNPDVQIWNVALGEYSYIAKMFVAKGDGMGSTFLRELDLIENVTGWKDTFIGKQTATVERFDQLGIDIQPYNTLVVDVQGMELDTLKGFGSDLGKLDFLNIECSRVPLYEGGCAAQEVIDYLALFGFQQDSPIEDHNDIKFIHERNL